jgi:glycosyltransferase involved in cell wall biosynthesis
MVFTGSMDWLPNEDAILFFAREILGRIKEKVPTIKLTVVGRNPSQRLLKELKEYPEINVIGSVEDVRPFMSRHVLYVIPLRIGGGTRIKAYEAMAMGKAVVSTAVGVEGLPIKDGEHVVLADNAEDFACAVVGLLGDEARREGIATKARSYVRRNFSWGKAAAAFAQA